MTSESTVNGPPTANVNAEQIKNVLMLAYFFPPCAEGGVMRVRAFAKHLLSYYWQPIVLTVNDDYYLSFTKDEALIRELANKITVVRTNSLEPKGKLIRGVRENVYGVRKTGKWFDQYFKGVLRTLYRTFAIPDEHILWLPQALWHGLDIIRRQKIDILFVTTPPHSAIIIGTLLSRLSGKPLVWDVRDDWVDNPLFDAGPWHRHMLARMLERWVVQNAHRVVCVTPESADAFRQRYPQQPGEKFLSIPNGFDKEELTFLQNKTQNNSSEKLRIVYAGTLGTTRTPEGLFQALKDLSKELPVERYFQLDFYGYARQDFVEMSHAMELDGIVKFHGFVSREESLRQLILSDASLVIIPEAEGSRTAIPGKLYEYIGGRKFVLALCPQNSASARLIQESKSGIVAPQDNPLSIKQGLLAMLESYQQGQLSVDISENMLRQYERSEHARQLAEIFNRI